MEGDIQISMSYSEGDTIRSEDGFAKMSSHTEQESCSVSNGDDVLPTQMSSGGSDCGKMDEVVSSQSEPSTQSEDYVPTTVSTEVSSSSVNSTEMLCVPAAASSGTDVPTSQSPLPHDPVGAQPAVNSQSIEEKVQPTEANDRSSRRRSFVADLLDDFAAEELNANRVDVAKITMRRSSISTAQKKVDDSTVKGKAVGRPRRSAAATAAVKNSVIAKAGKKRVTPVFDVEVGDMPSGLRPCLKRRKSSVQDLAKRISDKYRKKSGFSTPVVSGIRFNEKCAIKVITPMPGWDVGTVRMPESSDEEEDEEKNEGKKRQPRLTSALEITPESKNKLAAQFSDPEELEQGVVEFNAKMVFGDESDPDQCEKGKKRRKSVVPAVSPRLLLEDVTSDVDDMTSSPVVESSSTTQKSTSTDTVSQSSRDEKREEADKEGKKVRSDKRRSRRLSGYFPAVSVAPAPPAEPIEQPADLISAPIPSEVAAPKKKVEAPEAVAAKKKSRRSGLYSTVVAGSTDDSNSEKIRKTDLADDASEVVAARKKSRRSGLYSAVVAGSTSEDSSSEKTRKKDLSDKIPPQAAEPLNSGDLSQRRTRRRSGFVSYIEPTEDDLDQILSAEGVDVKRKGEQAVADTKSPLIAPASCPDSASTVPLLPADTGPVEPKVTVSTTEKIEVKPQPKPSAAEKAKSRRRSGFQRLPATIDAGSVATNTSPQDDANAVPVVKKTHFSSLQVHSEHWSTDVERGSGTQTPALPTVTETSSDGDPTKEKAKSRRRSEKPPTKSSESSSKEKKKKVADKTEKKKKGKSSSRVSPLPDAALPPPLVGVAKRFSIISWIQGVDPTQMDSSLEADMAAVDSILKTTEEERIRSEGHLESDSNMVGASSSESTVGDKENMLARQKKVKKTDRNKSALHHFLKPHPPVSVPADSDSATEKPAKRTSKRKSTAPVAESKRKPLASSVSTDTDDDVIEVLPGSHGPSSVPTGNRSVPTGIPMSKSSSHEGTGRRRTKATKAENKMRAVYLPELDHAPFSQLHCTVPLTVTRDEEVERLPPLPPLRSRPPSHRPTAARPIPKEPRVPPRNNDVIQCGERLTRDAAKEIADGFEDERDRFWYEHARECRKAAKESQWNDALRPRGLKHWLGGADVRHRARQWLVQWKQRVQKEAAASPKKKDSKKKCRGRRGGDYSDDSDYEEELSEGEGPQLDNPLILSGPSGCGKTALISALCDEFSMKRLEIHPGERRNGAALRARLAGAGQSHRVQPTGGISSFFSSSSKSSESNEKLKEKERTQTLIVVEHVDVYFSEQDKEFFSTLKALAVEARAPIIWTCTTLPHLELSREPALTSYQSIETRPAPTMTIARYLRSVVLAFARRLLPLDDVFSLVESCENDLRAALMDLQLGLAGNPDGPLCISYTARKLPAGSRDLNYVPRPTHVDIQQKREEEREKYEDVVLLVEGERDVVPSLRAVADLARDSLNNGSQMRDIVVDYIPILSHIDREERIRAQGQRRYLHYFSRVNRENVQIDSTGHLRTAFPAFNFYPFQLAPNTISSASLNSPNLYQQ